MQLGTKITLGVILLTTGVLIAAAGSNTAPTCSERVTKRELL